MFEGGWLDTMQRYIHFDDDDDGDDDDDHHVGTCQRVETDSDAPQSEFPVAVGPIAFRLKVSPKKHGSVNY